MRLGRETLEKVELNYSCSSLQKTSSKNPYAPRTLCNDLPNQCQRPERHLTVHTYLPSFYTPRKRKIWNKASPSQPSNVHTCHKAVR